MNKEKELRISADNGNIEAIKRLLKEQVNPNAQDSFGFPALEYALNSYPHIPEKDHLGVVRTLVENGADVNIKASNGQTPIFTASAEGLFEVVKYLHEKGADLNVRLDTGANAFHDISDGIINRPLNFRVKIQRDGKTVTLTDPDEIRQEIGSHPDDEFNARLKTAKYLIENGIDLNAELYESGQTALFRASDLGAEEIVELIVSTNSINLDQEDKWKMRAIQYASRQGHYGIVKILVNSGADVDVQEAYGFTALHEAAENGHIEIVKFLIEKGADPSIGLEKKYQSYVKGSTPFDVAKIAKQKEVADYLRKLKN